MNDIIGGLKESNQFPEWYEGLHKALYRANEFLGNNLFYLLCSYYYCFFYKDERAASRSEFANMLLAWDIDEDAAAKAYDFITENGKKKMDCK